MKKLSFALVILVTLSLTSGCYVPMLLSDTNISSKGGLGRNNDIQARDRVLENLPSSVRRYSSHIKDLSMDDVLWATDSEIDSNFIIVAFIYKEGNKSNGKTIANPDLFVYYYELGYPAMISFSRWKETDLQPAFNYQNLRTTLKEKYPEWYVQ